MKVAVYIVGSYQLLRNTGGMGLSSTNIISKSTWPSLSYITLVIAKYSLGLMGSKLIPVNIR